MKTSNGQIGFSLETIAVMLIQRGALSGKQPVAARVLARIEAAIEAAK